MNKNMPSRSNVLNMILLGAAIPCGSACFQTACGSQWLGKPSPEAISEARRLIKDKQTKPGIRRECQAFLAYIQA